uniref:Acetyltransferase (GNAT) family protein n=1 Tax=Mimivirus LCMiAC02 TaxID=2506609 RepID=A0A4D5XF46_9VIRU|nr:MAG: acetyltransferase (GNAT) family protein [Mimivirus LCMiAC02]
MLSIRELRKITNNPNPFTNLIYKHFFNIAKIPELEHTKINIKKLLLSDDMMGLLVYDKNDLVGYLIGEFKTLLNGRHVYHISYMFILPEYRNRKIGTDLINRLIKKCKIYKKHDSRMHITLTCDTYNKKVYNFYIKNKFTIDRQLRTGKKHDVMSLKI